LAKLDSTFSWLLNILWSYIEYAKTELQSKSFIWLKSRICIYRIFDRTKNDHCSLKHMYFGTLLIVCMYVYHRIIVYYLGSFVNLICFVETFWWLKRGFWVSKTLILGN
jgi:hypothetical protein